MIDPGLRTEPSFSTRSSHGKLSFTPRANVSKPLHKTQKSTCTNSNSFQHLVVILDKLERAKDLPKSETQYLYRTASAHLLLPPLIPLTSEKNESYLERVRTTLKEKMQSQRSEKNATRNKLRANNLIKVKARNYEDFRVWEKKAEAERELGKELKTCKAMHSLVLAQSSLPKSIFTRNHLAQTQTNSNSIGMKKDSREHERQTAENTSEGKEKLGKARDKITEIMRGCEVIERSAKESEKLLRVFAGNLGSSMKRTELVSGIIDRDV